uniref:Oxaloacetate tautomerase FAHD1, mitochondrial n=2 Tax=Lepeophtheirus salmonis TaxID=72036 RepID=D3PJM2_LEPSM|nr:Fumarylacetoacetate hydrolase domain-containing protein 1 homolog [Lepeophtheirus salmonis]
MSNLSRFTKIGRKIVGVGRNYKAHAIELKNEVPSSPMLFLKPTSSYIQSGERIEIPLGCSEIHHEIELGVIIKEKCSRVSDTEAASYIGGYVLALDMTCRDFQRTAMAKGYPWAMAKGFDTSCPVSEFISIDKIPDPGHVQLQCFVNDEMRQDGNTEDMIFSVSNLISYISDYFTLEEGDLILTGTPEGVGPVRNGDVIRGTIPNVIDIEFIVGRES